MVDTELTPFYSDNGSVFIGGTEFKGVVTEANVEGLERDITPQFTFSDSYVDQNRQAPSEVSLTMVASGGDVMRFVLGGSSTDVYPKVRVGDSARTRPIIKLLTFDRDLTAQKMWVFSGAYGISISESAGTEEAHSWDMSFKSLAKDTSFHWTKDAAGSPLLGPIP